MFFFVIEHKITKSITAGILVHTQYLHSLGLYHVTLLPVVGFANQVNNDCNMYAVICKDSCDAVQHHQRFNYSLPEIVSMSHSNVTACNLCHCHLLAHPQSVLLNESNTHFRHKEKSSDVHLEFQTFHLSFTQL